jgi:hypothetical protein
MTKKSKMNSLKIIMIIEYFIIVIYGTLLHFVFEWTGKWKPAGLIAAVNESSWEHLKLAFWPAFIIMLFQNPKLKDKVNNFLLAKTISFYVMPISIILIFYTYTTILGKNYLILDISTFFISVLIGVLIEYKIYKIPEINKPIKNLVYIFIFLILLAFCLLSYFPPKIFLFKDPVTQGFGIIK